MRAWVLLVLTLTAHRTLAFQMFSPRRPAPAKPDTATPIARMAYGEKALQRIWSTGKIYAHGLRRNPFDGSVGPGANASKVTAQAMMGVNGNAKGDAQILESAAVLNFVMWLSLMAGFSFLLGFYPAVYTRNAKDPRDHESVEVPKGLCTKCKFFFAQVFDGIMRLRALDNSTAEEIIDKGGLDAYMFLEYYRLMRWITLFLTGSTLSILCPMHYYFGTNGPEIDILSRVGINNLPQGSAAFWVHTAYVWYIVAVVVAFVVDAQSKFLKYRYHWLKCQPYPQAQTLLVESIPKKYCSDKACRAFFESMHGAEAVERVYVIRRAGMLYSLQAKVDTITSKLDAARKSLADEAADEHLENELEGLGNEMRAEAAKVNKAAAALEANPAELSPDTCSAETHPDGGDQGKEDYAQAEVFSSSAFVTFTSRRWKHSAFKEHYSSYADEFILSLAPDPDDVKYKNLGMMRAEQENYEMIGNFMLLGIFSCWMPAVIALSALTSLRNLQNEIPFVASLCQREPLLEGILEGILATLALKVCMGMLPALLMFIFKHFLCKTSGAMAQFHMQSWFFAFNVLFVVLVTAIGRSIISTFSVLAGNPSMILDMLALSMPTTSHFYLHYVILEWLGVAIEQLRFSNLLKYLAYRAMKTPEAEAKRKSEPEDEASFGMGSRFAKATTYTTIVLCFCTCCPLINLFAWVYFRLGSHTYTYLLCEAETKKPDLGGLFWVQAMKQTLFGLILFVVLMVGILEERGATVKPGLIAAGALVVIYWGWNKLEAVRWRELTLPEIIASDAFCEGSAAVRKGVYEDPALTQ
jgi:hypothetical protein